MSKPSSGHFSGTTGSIVNSKNLSQKSDSHAIIASKGIDTKEHPTKYKQLGSKKRKVLREKAKNRTITKEEYKRLHWQQRIDSRRKAGIEAFWAREKELILRNLPTTRNWSSQQRTDILNDKRPKYKGVTIQSHHTYSVAKYPHLANNGSLIYPATLYEHTNRWHARDFKTSLPGRPANYQIKEDF